MFHAHMLGASSEPSSLIALFKWLYSGLRDDITRYTARNQTGVIIAMRPICLRVSMKAPVPYNARLTRRFGAARQWKIGRCAADC